MKAFAHSTSPTPSATPRFVIAACSIALAFPGVGGAKDAAPAVANTPLFAFRVVHYFGDKVVNGYSPEGLVAGSDGYLYGGTNYGGRGNTGTIYRFDPVSERLITLHNFAADYSEGYDHNGPNLEGSDGNLYGFTANSGALSGGTLYRLGPHRQFRLIHNFELQSGPNPSAILEGQDHHLYGTAAIGGPERAGTVYSIDPAGVYRTLYAFGTNGERDGAAPISLVQTASGALYGTTSHTLKNPRGNGTVFTISPAGEESIIHRFSSGVDGSSPGPLTLARDGFIYGSTSFGGTGLNAGGVLYRFSPAGEFSTVHQFVAGDPANGYQPLGTLLHASDGYLYGTTLSGGEFGNGTIYRITPAGAFELLYSFADDVYFPIGLVETPNGRFFGIAGYGGTCTVSLDGCGAIYELERGQTK